MLGLNNRIQILFPILSIFIISCGGGSSSVSSSSSSNTFLDTGTSVSYNSSTASTHQGYDAYENVKGTDQSSHQNPYDQINAYKAYGYGFSGDGQQIAILDSRFDTNHYIYGGDKTVTTYGTLTADSTSSYHGNTVSSVAAGYLDTTYSGTVASHGVAYDADLHLSDYAQAGSETYYASQWANATNNASSAVVQNNSWGIDEEYNSGSSYSNSSLATMWTNSGLTSNASSVNDYITALNSFQDHGVVVYALSNTSSFNEADVQAALPEIYSQLAEAWITGVNIDITGSSGNEAYAIQSAPCGSTAAYCLGADGTKISAAAYYTDDSYFSTSGTTGTSFVAPQISGGIAIMAEAFPNQTPAQWTDRLLASADNSFLTASANVTFANGITHGYNTTYGHGVMDLYAALRPITSSRMKESILVGGSLNDSVVYNLENSFVQTPKVFGDSLSRQFTNRTAVFHDALYGNFEYDFGNSFINSQNTPTNTQKLHKHLNSYSFEKNSNDQSNTLGSKSFMFKKQMVDGHMTLDPNGFSNFTNLNEIKIYNSMNIPIEISSGFVSSVNSSKVILNDGFYNPFIPQNSFAIGTLFPSDKVEDNYSISFYDDSINNIENPRSGLVLTKSLLNNNNVNSSFMLGYGNEQNSILGAKTSGAFDQNENSPTIFLSHSFEKQLNDNTDFSIISSIGRTHFNNKNNNTLVNDISPIISSSFGISVVHNIDKNQNFIITFTQPHRLESGKANISLPQSTGLDGTLNYDKQEVNLSPSGRQLDLSLRYNKNILKDDLLLSFENITTHDEGHISSNDLINNSFVSLNYIF